MPSFIMRLLSSSTNCKVVDSNHDITRNAPSATGRASSEKEHASYMSALEKAWDHKEDVGQALIEYMRKEDEVQKAHEHHMDRAKARFESGNSAGSVISMRKVKRLEGQDVNLNQAVQLLALRKVALVRFIKKHEKERSSSSKVLEERTMNPSDCDDGFTLSVCNDLLTSELGRIKKSAKDEFSALSDEDLLRELAAINIGVEEEESDDEDEDDCSEDELLLDIDRILMRLK